MENTIPSDYELTDEEREDLQQSVGFEEIPIRFRNQDFDVRGLVQRMKSEDILIPRIGLRNESLEMNAFQRGFVWNNRQMDSFVESLLLEYPTPSIFLVQQNDRRLIVLDGQQRLETLRVFYSGIRKDRKYRLHLPGSKFDGLSYDELDDKYRRLLDNTYITTTIITPSPSNPERSYEAIYDVFARLNSGGAQLTAHEIRLALYNGDLMDSIDLVNTTCEAWRTLYGSKEPNKRFRDHELILRVIAMYLEGDAYRKPLATFLNSFSSKYRNGGHSAVQDALCRYRLAAKLLVESGHQFPLSIPGGRQINTAKVDSVLVGLMSALSHGDISAAFVNSCLSKLEGDNAYLEAIGRSTSDEQQVVTRITLAKKVFAGE